MILRVCDDGERRTKHAYKQGQREEQTLLSRCSGYWSQFESRAHLKVPRDKWLKRDLGETAMILELHRDRPWRNNVVRRRHEDSVFIAGVASRCLEIEA